MPGQRLSDEDAERKAEFRPHPEARLGGFRTCSARRLWRGRRSISPGADAPQEDRIELWGRRVGRILAVIFAIYLVIMLAEHFTR